MIDPTEYCQPNDTLPRKWLLRFDDADKKEAVYTDETQAREAYEKACGLGYNCYLFCTAQLRAQRAAGNVPAYFVLVPVEPTQEMRLAFQNAQDEWEDGGYDSPDHQWKAMLAAAPTQPTQGQEGNGL